MTSSADWPQVDPMPTMVSSSDLFDGDILGDELIDIYNAAIVGESDDDDAIHEIPSLLASADDKDMEPSSLGGTLSADDGLGAFRPSASFNDLTGLLSTPDTKQSVSVTSAVGPTATLTAVTEAVSGQATVISTHAPSTSNADASAAVATAALASKKRPVAGTEGPSPKRRVSTASGRKGPASPRAKANSIVEATRSVTAQAATNLKVAAGVKPADKRNTPNPLSLSSLPVGKSIVKAPVVVKAAVSGAQAGTAVPPAVVSPRVQQQQQQKVQDQGQTQALAQPNKSISSTSEARATPAPVPSAPVPTEADFKSVAQAAVSNLIMNAGSKVAESDTPVAPVASKDAPLRVDTSTEHIKALTGSNWVAVCAPPDGSPASASEKAAAAAAANNANNNRARRQNLTPDERARQNRDRNREHARNTRLRKKAYVEELKRTLTELVAQRDTSELERRHAAQRELEQREVRFRVMEEFLKIRGRNEPNSTRWAAILEDSFIFTLPVTNFRRMVNEPASPAMEQSLTGVSEVMADSASFSAFLQTFHNRTSAAGAHAVTFSYQCDRANFFMDNCNAVLEWSASTDGAVQRGATAELALKGTMRAKFSPASNKLVSACLAFDTGLIASQLGYQLPSSVKREISELMDVDAAQAAASEADAILDSLQMPHIEATVPTNVTVVPPSSCSENSSGASVASADDSLPEARAKKYAAVTRASVSAAATD